MEKTRKIQNDHVQVLRQDSGASKNIYLLDKKNIHNNRMQVINQYEEGSGTRDVRYDVTVLVNGLPMVHIELKRRGVAIREAFNQIKRYQRDSFWAASGLYESMCRSLSFPTARTRSIIPTPLEAATSGR